MQECLRWAAGATTDGERNSFLQMAKAWHEAALEVERSMGLVDESRQLLDRSKRK